MTCWLQYSKAKQPLKVKIIWFRGKDCKRRHEKAKVDGAVIEAQENRAREKEEREEVRTHKTEKINLWKEERGTWEHQRRERKETFSRSRKVEEKEAGNGEVFSITESETKREERERRAREGNGKRRKKEKKGRDPEG